jgi:hypothetical protein
VVAFGLNVPIPPLQVPLTAAPPIVPVSCTVGEAAHVIWSAPAVTVAAGLIVILIWSLAGGQGPLEAALVSVSVTPPAAISAGLGV